MRSEAIETAKAAADAEDYQNAITALNNAIDIIGADVELSTFQSNYITAYKECAYEEARRLFTEEGYDSSVAYLRSVLTVTGTDEDITRLINEYENCKHMRYYDMVSIESPYYYDGTSKDFYSWYDSWYDSEGNSQNNVIYYPYGDISTRLVLNKEFQKCTGTLFYFLNQKGKNDRASVKIYGDEELIYEQEISSADVSVKFDVDISNVVFLKVVLYTGHESLAGNTYAYAGISNFDLHKSYINESW